MAWANDNLTAATGLSGASGSITPLAYDGTTDPATSEAGESLYGTGETLWWTWTAPSSGQFEFDTLDSPDSTSSAGGLDTKMQVFSGPASSPTHAGLTLIGQNDDHGTGAAYDYNSRVVFTATAGTTYYVQVDQYGTGQVGTLHLSWGVYIPPPPVVDTVRGDHPGLLWVTNELMTGHTVRVDGSNLTGVTKIRLPGLDVLAADFTAHTDALITFLLPTTPGIGSGTFRVQIGEGSYTDTSGVYVLYPETSWRTPAAVSATGMLENAGSVMQAGRYIEIGSSRAGDAGTATYYGYSDTPPPKFGAKGDGTIYQENVVLGITDGYSSSVDGIVSVRPYANLDPATQSPPAPSGSPPAWRWEYQGQPTGAQFAPDSPESVRDKLTGLTVHLTLEANYFYPRLSDTTYELYALLASETASTEVANVPDVHFVKPGSWFTPDRLLASGQGPNYQPAVSWSFDDGTTMGFVAVSTALSPSGGFSGGGLKATGAGEFRSPIVGATPNHPYRINCWIGRAPADGGTVRVGIAWLDRSGVEISTTWGAWNPVASDVDTGNFTNATWVNTVAPDDGAVWSRQLVFQFTGCASLEIDAVNFLADDGGVGGGPYYMPQALAIPASMIYRDPNDELYVTIIGTTPPARTGATGPGEISYYSSGADLSGTWRGSYYFQIGYTPTPWRYWLPAPVATLDPTAVGWRVGAVAW